MGLMMSAQSWRFIRAQGLADAHIVVFDAFNRQLAWWVYVPLLGWGRIRTRNKLIRVGNYLVAQARENNAIGEFQKRENNG